MSADSGKEEARRKVRELASLHPIRSSVMRDILRELGMGWDDIDDMVRKGELKEVVHGGEVFYIAEKEQP